MSNRFVDQGLSAPVNLTWEVTLACNLRCRHCLSSSGAAGPGELGTAEALEAVDQLHRAGVFQLNFGGGEPFIRTDFEAILDACHARGMVTCISTNGTLLDAARVERLSRSGLVAIQVSLDGARRETCDALRGDGTFDRALRALELLRESAIPTSINTVLTGPNAGEIPALYDLAGSLGVSLRVSRFRPSGRGAVNWDGLRPSPAQLLAFSTWLTSTASVRTGDSFFSLTPQERQGLGLNLCGAAKLTACLGPDGSLYPCAFLQREEFRAGSLRERSFQEIWDRSDVFRSFRSLRIHSCEDCHRYDQCHGGCPAVAYHLGRGVAGGDPECLVNCVTSCA
ncbi:mycofactocin radical SAM maturase [Anaeromyxobacter oryzae]|uniref:Mycofactocin radical SAM maturase MftC n=1 Tax=Anaeromyxobacter oryzae TaxID=2918170 RepID=A0ABM7X1C9_9BACT|nr:mycofactocin radical SAM maturase [Anaeromyxobacter oryzae]BDG05568.1 putative mycofactocin radical SAM maturase MftC [Anaeromyxobacter oryzae]